MYDMYKDYLKEKFETNSNKILTSWTKFSWSNWNFLLRSRRQKVRQSHANVIIIVLINFKRRDTRVHSAKPINQKRRLWASCDARGQHRNNGRCMPHKNKLFAARNPIRLPIHAHLPQIHKLRIPIRLLQVWPRRAVSVQSDASEHSSLEPPLELRLRY